MTEYPYTEQMREAYRLLVNMTADQRGLIFVWFCHDCGKHLEDRETSDDHECKLAD